MLHPHVVRNFTQRLWAYLTIKELLKKRLISDDTEEKEEFEERALNLSLKYHFVTPLTSLVVVKPDRSNDTTSEKTEDNDRDEADLMIPPTLIAGKIVSSKFAIGNMQVGQSPNNPYQGGQYAVGNLQVGPRPNNYNPNQRGQYAGLPNIPSQRVPRPNNPNQRGQYAGLPNIPNQRVPGPNNPNRRGQYAGLPNIPNQRVPRPNIPNQRGHPLPVGNIQVGSRQTHPYQSNTDGNLPFDPRPGGPQQGGQYTVGNLPGGSHHHRGQNPGRTVSNLQIGPRPGGPWQGGK